MTLSYKIEVYLEGTNNHQIKLTDITKIIKLWATLDSLPELKQKFDDFHASVTAKITKIESLKKNKQTESALSKSATVTTD